jgi:hypothetical protein
VVARVGHRVVLPPCSSRGGLITNTSVQEGVIKRVHDIVGNA